MTQRDKEYVWQKAKPIRGKDPKKYRRDHFGNEIFKGSYGKHSPMGWEVDHIVPKSKGGSNRRCNLQALQTGANRRKSNKVPRRRNKKAKRS